MEKIGGGAVLFFAGFVSICGSLLLLWFNRHNSDISPEGAGVSPYIVLFAFGMLAADLALGDNQTANNLKIRYMKVAPWLVGIAIIAFLIISAMVRHYLNRDNVYLQELEFSDKMFDIMLGFFFAFILFVCSIPSRTPNDFWLLRIFSWRPLVFVGTFSYSLYLIHAPLLVCIYQYVLVPMHLSRFTACMLLITVGSAMIIFISYFFFYLFERPFLTPGKKSDPVFETIINPAP